MIVSCVKPTLKTTQFLTVLPCLYVADPATLPASNSVLGTLLSSQMSLFSQDLVLLCWVVGCTVTINCILLTTLMCSKRTTFPLSMFRLIRDCSEQLSGFKVCISSHFDLQDSVTKQDV